MKPPRSPIDDDQDATEALLNVAGTKMFDHQLAQLRQQRMDQAAYAEAAAHYEAQGYTVLPERPQWRDRSRVGLRHLRTADGDIASEEAVTKPAHWAIVVASQSPWRMPMPAGLQNSHRNGGHIFLVYMANPRARRWHRNLLLRSVNGYSLAEPCDPGRSRSRVNRSLILSL
jgi:hypothetical protein